MSESEETVRCTKMAKNVLIQKKKNTGHSMSKLVEYAILNMPYIPPKRVK